MEERPILRPNQARQAVVGHNVRYVLIGSCLLVVGAFIVIAFIMAR